MAHGADFNYQKPLTLLTPLHWGSYNNDISVVQFLLSKGAVLKFSSNLETPLSVAGNGQNIQIAYALLDNWWKINGQDLIKNLGLLIKEKIDLEYTKIT